MATRIRTLTFLPEIFQTPTNAQFLGATLDQLVNPPLTRRIQGFIGSKFGYGVNAKDDYVTEPTKTRTDYQLDPGVVFTKLNDTTAKDFLSYPGLIDALKAAGANTDNNDRLFNSQFYSWDPFVDLDKVINYNQYYWIPEGPPAVSVELVTIPEQRNFTVVDDSNSYEIDVLNPDSYQSNPTITLLRGGSYTFSVTQPGNFWIQGAPGVDGTKPLFPNQSTRDILGVTNNGANVGLVFFDVPLADAQSEYNLPGNNQVDLISTISYANLNGAQLSSIGGAIDGVTSLDGLNLMFFTGSSDPIETNNFYTISYTGNIADPTITLTASTAIPSSEKITARFGTEYVGVSFFKNISGVIEQIPYLSAELNTLYYQDSLNPDKVGVIKLVDSNAENILDIDADILGKINYTAPNGVVFTNGLKVEFNGNIFPDSYQQDSYYVQGVGNSIQLIPASTLSTPEPYTVSSLIPYDTTPYDIGAYDASSFLPVDLDYITIARNAINKNAWSRSNRWFHIEVVRASALYNNDPTILTRFATAENKAKRPIIEFYPNLRLFQSGTVGKNSVDFIDFRTTNAFTEVAGQLVYYPDVEVYSTDTANIAEAGATFTGSISGFTLTVTSVSTGTITVGSTISGLGVLVGTTITGQLSGTTGGIGTYSVSVAQPVGSTTIESSVTEGTITVPASSVSYVDKLNIRGENIPGKLAAGMYISDSQNVLPANSRVKSVVESSGTLTITVEWDSPANFSAVSAVSFVADNLNNNNYALFSGARIIFAADTNDQVRNKIYVADFSQVVSPGPQVITLSEAPDGEVLHDDQVVVLRGYLSQGVGYYFDTDEWKTAQQKKTVNQAPLFDVFDENGVSFGDQDLYIGSSFKGSTLFSYGIGEGPDDPILGFPIKFSSINNVGDISFDVTFNSQKFDYVQGNTSITGYNINNGFVYDYSNRIDYTRLIGYQTAVAPSTQYQLFQFEYTAGSPPVLLAEGETLTATYVLDIPLLSDNESTWPIIQVYNNNQLLSSSDYSYTVSATSTTVEVFLTKDEDTVIQIVALSDSVSQQAYYQIPINLSNNPFNEDITQADLGDIRSQYQSIFYNNPNTSGNVFGSNNYRDLGNLVPWGSKIIQNSASLVLPAAFLRQPNHNLFDALLFNSREYIKFKTLLIDTVDKADLTQRFDPATLLDDALEQITSVKNQAQPFFWSDMLPSKAPFVSNHYTFANDLDTSIYPLSRVYDFSTANYYGVLVYVQRTVNGVTFTTQLIKGSDYTVSSTEPSLTITYDLLAGDIVTINEYNQTYGSYVPNTPTKLGLYPSSIPAVVLDTAYNQPTYFIKGHDGSYNKLYGDYDPETGILVDFRDQVLLEFEKRVYNNLKLGSTIPLTTYEVLPGFFRDSDYSYDQWLQMYSVNFLDWVGQNRLDYKKQLYAVNDPYSWNYSQSSNKVNREVITIGNWRGIYEYFYDTSTPNTTPWEMLGFTDQPSWWTNRYGAAPYTSDNLLLWSDLAQGINWNNGDPIVLPQAVRDGLLDIIPVDYQGNLVQPLDAVIANYNPNLFRKNWKVGDVGPVELSYRRSSTWPFDLMRLIALTKPAEFFNLGVDLDNYRYNAEFNQYLVNGRSHLDIRQIEVYGNGTAKTSYVNWIVDYEKQLGVNATQNIKDLLTYLDVRLVYRLAGYSDKTMLKFYVEKGTPNSTNASLLIPDESFSILLYDNQPFDKLIYSSIIVQAVPNGFAVYGNSQSNAFFRVLKPVLNGNLDQITVEKLTVEVANQYNVQEDIVPYGTMYMTVQELSQFIMSYGKYLESKGMIFDQLLNGLEVNWRQMIAEFLYWAQTGWEVGSVITLNPAAQQLKIDRPSQIVQPLTLQQQNFILNQNLYPIQANDLAVLRDGTLFQVRAQNEGDTLAYGQFNLSNFEHGIVFNNTTLFDDVIYNLATGLRQSRIQVYGTKTAEWNGTVTAYGFILNQDNIEEWKKEAKYTKGQIVKYKNKFWTALKIVQPNQKFNELEWKETDYDEIQKGLLPNSSTRSYESNLYYDVNRANLENEADLLSFSLIGFRPRDYLALADLTDITQVNVYKNLIKNKGTRNSVDAFRGAMLPQGGIDYQVYENWAIKSGEFGAVLNDNFIEFKLNQPSLTSNPSIVSLTDGVYTEGSQQEVPIYSLYNYGRPITSPDVLPTISTTAPSSVYPTAGYVNFNDVKMSAYFAAQLPVAVNKDNVVVTLNDFYVRDYVWLANFLNTWQVMAPISIGQVIAVKNNLNGTATVTFAEDHGLTKNNMIAIIAFDNLVNGYYLVNEVLNPTQVSVTLSFNNAAREINGEGVGVKLISQRVATPADIANLPLLSAEFVKNTVWVDEDQDGEWAVYRKGINYKYEQEFTSNVALSFGSSVATSPDLGYLIGDADAGAVYRYTFNPLLDSYIPVQTVTGNASFGTTIAHNQDIYVISEPSGSPAVNIYYLADSVLTDDLTLYQNAITRPITVTGEWGSALAISGDAKWIYVSAKTDNQVHVYRKQDIPLQAGYFNTGETYIITSVGTTDFTAIGAIENKIGTRFIATGVGSGTGEATQVTYKPSYIIDGSAIPVVGDFGSSIATDHAGDTILIGAPSEDYDLNTAAWGKVYVYNRLTQNIEAQTSTQNGFNQQFTLAWTPVTQSKTVSATASGTNLITLNNTTSLSVNDPIIFQGTNLIDTNVVANKVYYINSISGSDITIKTSRSSTTPVTLLTKGGISGVTASAQTTPLYVSRNGTIVHDDQYGVVGSTLVYTGDLTAGDIITVTGNEYVYIQTLTTEENPRIGVRFGTSVDVTKFGSQSIIGAPFALNSTNQEGAVYCFTDGGSKYGQIIGTQTTNVTSSRKLLLNGFLVNIPVGNAQVAASAINSTNITNIQAQDSSGNLVISVINADLAVPNEKLVISATDSTTLSELGIQLFTQTQIVTAPHQEGPSQFGTVVKFNEEGSFVASAPTGIRYASTTFDFTDDENYENDTVFDNNATQFLDSSVNAGAVYMFDYLGVYGESLANPGNYIYAQSVNAQNQNYGAQPRYGTALDFRSNKVIIGTRGFNNGVELGQATVYENQSGVKDWSIYRKSAPVIDINRIQNSQIFSAETNNTLINLDYMDPLQGKLLGAIRENIDVVSNVDPASYNNGETEQRGMVWGAEHVGRMWFDTTNVRFVNYHQNDVVYNSKYWGQLFPGSDVAVYTWVASTVPPAQYQGPGTPYNIALFTTQTTINSNNVIVPVYYFWARNTNIIDRKLGKTLADTILQTYIANPQGSGISYISPLLPNSVALYNCAPYINANDSVLHIGYQTGTSGDQGHTEFTLVRTDFADDFLPGVPSINGPIVPESLYDRLLDSLSGVDEAGAVVPNPFLPKSVQSGVLARPRQSFFYNRYKALENYLTYANEILSQFPIIETKQSRFLYAKNSVIYQEILPASLEVGKTYIIEVSGDTDWVSIGAENNNVGTSFVATGAGSGTGVAKTVLFEEGEAYDTADYWERVNWWAPGYDNNTKSALQVPLYADLYTLNVAIGTIVTVGTNNNLMSETYRFDGDGIWTRIGLKNGTIRFKSILWDYQEGQFGYGENFYDTTPYDSYPSEETRWIVRALNEEIYTDELLIYRNKSLILLFEYIQSETIESQNFLPWLNKTSLVDVSHKIRELREFEVFQSDNQDFLSGYLNEAKPYHVVIKDFLFEYTGEDVFEGDLTDFDLPSSYDSTIQEFVTPELVYANPSGDAQFLPDSDIWLDPKYAQWYQNRGLSLTGDSNYQITILSSYVTLASTFILVDNASGFPVSGVIKIGNDTIGYEEIGYTSVDRTLNVLTGLTRGVNGTTTVDHIPGELIVIDLPPVIVLDSGRGYVNPPSVYTLYDTTTFPEPIEQAVLEPVMSADTVIGVNVINPGKGYPVQPDIIIEPAFSVTFSSSGVLPLTDTIKIDQQVLVTGDVVRYVATGVGTAVGGLANGAWYYVRLLEVIPASVIALYTSYADAINDTDRVNLLSTGTGTHTLSVGARASATTTPHPKRGIDTTLRFDRTTYTSQVQDWQAGVFYGSFFAGDYENSEDISSSSITLQSTQPDINNILASAQGVAFEIAEISNDRNVIFSSFERSVESVVTSDTIRLTVSNPGDTASGSTVGFTVGMPVKFIGEVGSTTIVNEQVYYIAEVVDETDFKISATESGTPINTLVPGTIGIAGLKMFTAQIVDKGILTVNYPGIRSITATQATTNYVTAPFTAVGTGGTKGFYVNLPLMFTGTAFGGVEENVTYFVTTVIDGQTFTMSKNQDPLMITAVATDSTTDKVTVQTVQGLSVNDPIIFTDAIIANVATTTFGGISTGVTYYVREIFTTVPPALPTITLSDAINGNLVNITSTVVAATGTEATVTNQKDTVKLNTASGQMTMNVSLPVSPGQVNGQQFTLYTSSNWTANVATVQISDLISGNVTATLAANDIVLIEPETDLSLVYDNLPVRFDSTIGGLSTGTTYYIIDMGQVSVAVTQALSNEFVCDDTADLYDGMPIVFTGSQIGGIVIGQTYYVAGAPTSSTTFQITDVQYDPPISLTNGTGSMTGIGDKWIQVSASQGGPAQTVSDDIGPVTLEQYIVTQPIFDVSNILGGYRVIIDDPGEGFAINNTITIAGNLIGGATPANDLVMTVNTISDTGEITDVICAGTVADTQAKYYLKVISTTQFEVYANPIMTIPVSGTALDAIFDGFLTTTATAVSSSGIVISDPVVTVDSVTGYEVNNGIVFTGQVFGNIVAGQTYYILEIDSVNNQISISENPGDAVFTVGTGSGSMTVGRAGSYALLPEPFSYNRSIVKYGNKVYMCVISNNDDEFILGKWLELRSDDRRLNALDRIIGYYAPTVNMPGVDLTQLVGNIVYPNTTYYGNAFDPGQQFQLDLQMQGDPFYPTNVDMVSIVKDGEGYLIAANLPDYAALVRNLESESSWMIGKFASIPLSFTDMLNIGNRYVMTSTNSATPIFRSADGAVWSVNGLYTTDIALPWDGTPNNYTSLNSASLSMNSVAYKDGIWVTVGNKVLVSDDTIIWRDAYTPNTGLAWNLNSVCAVDISGFSGFVAVGKGQRFDYSTGFTLIKDTNIVVYSSDGINWSEVPSFTVNGLNSVSASATEIVAVGENGVIYMSTNGASWEGINETEVISTNGATDILNVHNTSGLQVNDIVQFSDDFDVLTAGVDYYVSSILSSTQIQISAGPTPAPIIDLTGTGSIPFQTLMYKVPQTLSLNAIEYANSIYIAAGDGNATAPTQSILLSSSNVVSWTTLTANVTANLNAINFDGTSNTWTIVGDQNTLIQSIDNGSNWVANTAFTVSAPVYNIQGEPFLYGYGPEELVPGYLTDNLTMIVNTRPGTNWPATEYAHVGYNVVSTEIVPESGTQTQYSFAGLVNTPAQIAVFIINGTTNTSTSLYEGNDYAVDWVNQTVNINNPLAYLPISDSLRIDVYEVGNGDQIVKSTSKVNPVTTNSSTGFDEISLGCNYSALRVNGGGVIRPGTYSVTTTATDTDTVDNTITVVSTANLVLNASIQFNAPIGGLLADTNYYIKTISTSTNKITVSASLTGLGVAAAVEPITVVETGVDVDVIISVGAGIVWTDPIVYKNGGKLVMGKTGTITRSKVTNNALTCISTLGLSVGDPIIFGNTIFGGLSALTTYYIQSIVDNNEFTVSATQGGPQLGLTNAVGRATYITHDYGIAVSSDGTTAKMVLADQVDTATEYLAYSFFTETTPEQYGYTIPETQVLIGDSSNTVFSLSNYVGADNANAAVVEYDGLRLLPSAYTIDPANQDITMSFTPQSGNILAITTFNDTARQYFSTNVDASTATTVAPIAAIDNAINGPVGTPTVTQTYSSNNSIVCTSTTGFATGQLVLFKTAGVPSFDTNIEVDGTYYFVETVVSGTEFTIMDQYGSQIALAGGSGLMIAVVGETPAIDITTSVAHGLSTNDIVRIDGVQGAIQLNNNNYYVHVVDDDEFFLYDTPYDPELNAVNQPVTQISGYTGGGYVWLSGQYVLYTTIGQSVDANSYIQTTTASDLRVETPVIFTEQGVALGDATSLGTIAGQTYYIHDILGSGFRISATRGGSPTTLSVVAPTVNVLVSQWEQDNVDRLWVTVNGLRIPSSSLRLNPANELSILTAIQPGDDIIITSMMPSGTPDQETYMLTVDRNGQGVVYRANSNVTTWLAQPITDLSTTIYLDDVSKVTDTVVQNSVTPALVDGVYNIGLDADKSQITGVTIYNSTTASTIDPENYEIILTDTAPEVSITAGAYITAGDQLVISILVGNTLYVNGEQIRFGSVDLVNNTVSGLQRGVNGTGKQTYIPVLTRVYGLLSSSILNPNEYNKTWNSYDYNAVEGDPLQISNTPAAQFLNMDVLV